MIGKQMRGIHHLVRNLDETPKHIFFICNGLSYKLGDAIKVKNPSDNNDCILIFNNVYDNDEMCFDKYIGDKIYPTIQNLRDKWQYVMVIGNCDNIANCNAYGDLFQNICILPDDISEKYEKFCNENNKKIESIFKYNEYINEETLKIFYLLSNGSKNYFFWAIKLYYDCNVTLVTINRIMYWAMKYSQLSKFLKRGSITAYNNYISISSLMSEMIELRKEKRIKDTINSFNTEQKKILKEVTLSDYEKDVISKFYKLSDNKKRNFIRKMSTETDAHGIIKEMSFIVQITFQWSKESLIDYIKNNEYVKAEIVFENGNIVVVNVLDYDTAKYLGKNTSWCISKNKTYWGQYLNNQTNKQYIVFDFSQKEDSSTSIVGFTTAINKGIIFAHNLNNDNIMPNEEEKRYPQLNTIFTHKKLNIFSLLNDYGVDKEKFISYEKLPYKWDKESFIKYINENIGKENYKILQDLGDKLCVVVRSENIKKLFDKSYSQKISTRWQKMKHILFMDFSLNEKDSNKFTFAIISCGGYNEEVINILDSFCYNSSRSFDSILVDFKLPYNIISRPIDIVEILDRAMDNFEINVIEDLCSKFNIISMVKQYQEMESHLSYYSYRLEYSIFELQTSDVLNAFYKYGIKLNDLIGEEQTSYFLIKLFSLLKDLGRKTKCEVPTDDDIKLFNDKKLTDRFKIKQIFLFSLFKEIINKENNLNCFRQLIDIFENNNGDLSQYLARLIAQKIDKKDKNDVITLLVKFLLKTDDKNILDYLLKIGNKQVNTYIEFVKNENIKHIELLRNEVAKLV